MAQYLVLIYGDEQQWSDRSPDQLAALDTGHQDFRAAAGKGLLGGHELQTSTKAVTVRSGSDGGPIRTDGPFVETKEALGGYYVLEAQSLEAAVDLAERLPEVADSHSGVEVRPVA